MCTIAVCNIEFGRVTSFWQQECDEGIPLGGIEPHCPSICLQHSRSASLISVVAEARQAIAG